MCVTSRSKLHSTNNQLYIILDNNMQRCRAKILKKSGSYRHCKRSTTSDDHLCWQHALCADQTTPRCVVSIGDHACKRKGHTRYGGKCWQHASTPLIAEPGFCCCICLAEPSGSMVVQLGSCGHRVHAHCLDTMLSCTNVPRCPRCPMCRGPINASLTKYYGYRYALMLSIGNIMNSLSLTTSSANADDKVRTTQLVLRMLNKVCAQSWVLTIRSSLRQFLLEMIRYVKQHTNNTQTRKIESYQEQLCLC